MSKNKENSCSLNQGTVAIYGGEVSASTLGTFVDLISINSGKGVKEKSVTVITHAAEDPREEGRFLEADFQRLGVERVEVLYPGDSANRLESATAVYACGGDQGRLLRLAKRDGYLPVLKKLHEAGVPYGCSSAGAAATSAVMIADGGNDGILRVGVLEFKKGFGLLQKVLIDTHLARSGRIGRDMNILATQESIEMIIGLEEDTGLILKGCNALVVGSRQVWVFRRSSAYSTSRPGKGDRERFNATGALVDVYTGGDSFYFPSI